MKKWMQCAVSVALAGCFALSLTACKEEDAPGESAESQFLDDAVHALVQEDYVTADIALSMKQSAEYGDEEERTSLKMRFAKNEQYGVDYSVVRTYEGGYTNETLVVDGVQYLPRQTSDGNVLYYAYPAGTGMAPTVEVISEMILSQDVFGIVDSLYSMARLDEVSGIETDTSKDEMTVRAELEELKSGLLAYLEGLKKSSLDGLNETVNGLLDENITLVDFLDKLNGVLAPEGLVLEEILNDRFVASVLLLALTNGTPTAEELEAVYGDPAGFLYEVLRANGGEQVTNILSEPQAGETVYEYIRRVFGQFKVTGIIDMFYGTGSGAQGFAELKEEFASWAEGKTAYDLAELLWERMVGPYTSLTEYVEEFKKIDFGESYFEASFKADKKGRLTSASFEFNMDAVYTDGDFSDQAEAVYSGTMTLSYDAFTLEAPSKDQLVPSVGASEVDLEAGTVFIPIEWNSAKPDDFVFVTAYLEGEIVVHEQDEWDDYEWSDWVVFEDIDLMQFVETHKTEEGVLVDFSGLVITVKKQKCCAARRAEARRAVF
ncbi:MAG TPA: hypothetical protein H9797_00860 [Candidatus Gallimonas gallistercoris]|uniref:Lipoprotein n=1 Tax=Candidatus Gallimonas gallistercoris TaxID=2838602 RepID=A0A9D2GZN3_9FIRM|nr:hypothetical protein [Candidatus Gallimonas gallistercoris]